MLSHNAQIHTHGTISLSTYQVAQTVKRLPTMRETRFDPWVGKIPWRRKRQPTTVFMPGKSHGRRSLVDCSPWGRWSRTRLSNFTFTFHFHALEKEMATHSSVLAWRIPGTGKPGGLPSLGSHRVGHD